MPEKGLGEWLYGYTASNSVYADSTGNTDKYWKHPLGIFLLFVLAFLLFWFVYTIVFAAINGGSVLSHASDAFAVFVMAAIILLSVFGGWGHLTRLQAAMRARGKKDNEEYKKEVEAQNKHINSFNVFPCHIVLKCAGNETVLDRNYLETVKLLRGAEGYEVVFVSSFGEEIFFEELTVPYAQFKKLKELFKNQLTVKNGENAFGSKYVNKKIATPVVFGAFFIALTLFFGVPIFSHFKSFHEFLCGFNGLYAGLVFFFAIGIVAAASGIITLVKLIIYKVDKCF